MSTYRVFIAIDAAMLAAILAVLIWLGCPILFIPALGLYALGHQTGREAA